jgi:hypothetical protein
MRSLLVLLYVLITSLSNAQIRNAPKSFDSLSITPNAINYTSKLSNKYTIPKEFELAIAIALSYYPELAETKIKFKFQKINTTLNARPTITSLLFSKREDRIYILRINNSSKDSVINVSDVPFNAKIGLFAHEFSHFTDYSKKSMFGVIGRGISYASKKSKATFEKEIDLKTIERGLGWQLYAWSNFVLNESKADIKYKQFKKETYMTPESILEMIKSTYIISDELNTNQ